MTSWFAPLAANPAQGGLYTDFDGTLAPIVDDPEDARPIDGAVETLTTLAERLGRVGVISGRPAGFLLRHINSPRIGLWGQHGLETVEDEQVVPVGAAEEWLSALDEAAAGVADELGPLVEIERKSQGLTLHYRRAPAEAERVRDWAERTAAATGLVLYAGRMSAELRPPIPHGKGHTLETAARQAELAAVAFAGDDVGDVAAFDALDRLAADGVDVVRIGVASEEAPTDLLDRADLVLDSPHDVLAAFQDLAAALGGR